MRSRTQMTSETVRINIIRKCLTERDRLDIENLNTCEKMMEVLCLHYDGLAELGPAEINNLYKLTNPAPGDYQSILDNFIRVEPTFKFLHE